MGIRGEILNLIITNNSTKPIYEQIVQQIKENIMDGSLKPGQPIMSMRKLASELHISVITVQKAYESLQRDGFIETVSGKGTYVSNYNIDFIQEEHLRRVEIHIEEAVQIALENGIDVEKIIELVRLFYST